MKIEKNKNIGLIIAIIILSCALLTFIVLYSVSMCEQNKLNTTLENSYQNSFNELVDNINNTEIKLSKAMVNDSAYQKKMLLEVSKNSAQAATSLSDLPISINGIDGTIKFVNEVSGYTQSLADKLDRDESLTSAETQTLKELKIALKDLKNNINELSKDIYNGNIYDESKKLDGDYNNFTLKLQNIKAGDVDYPTMIYDGPFSESTINRPVKNLNYSEKTKEDCKQELKRIFASASDDDIEYLGDTKGKFDTYNYEIKLNDSISYIQMTKKGGKLITMSSNNSNQGQNYSKEQCIKKAIDFANKCGIENISCVWSDIVEDDAYINLAPVENNVILYPDIIKVKVDLFSGAVIGYEASTYYTNHMQRKMPSVSITELTAKNCVPQDFVKHSVKVCVAPIDYNKEVLCYEIYCTNFGEEYYIYVNATSGKIENVLKVVNTDDGSLLM